MCVVERMNRRRRGETEADSVRMSVASKALENRRRDCSTFLCASNRIVADGPGAVGSFDLGQFPDRGLWTLVWYRARDLGQVGNMRFKERRKPI